MRAGTTRPPATGTAGLLLGALATGGTLGCAYDLDRLERAARASDGGANEAGLGVPDDLIDLFGEAKNLDPECERCAANHCAEANAACHDDPECEQVTACLARSHDPRNHAECREQHRDWFERHIADIDVGGPFFDCVFWRACRSQCGADTDLACLGEYRWPRAESGAELDLTLLLQEALLGTPGAGATARVCRLEDLDCEDPSMTAKADDEGMVDLRLPAPLGQFTGYVEITGGALAPTLLVFGWPVSTGDARRMPIVSESILQAQQQFGGRTVTSGSGMLQTRVRGCSRVGTRDVRIRVEPAGEGTETWYYDDQAPNFDADATFSNGNAGVVNVPPGLVDVVGTRAGDSHEVLRWKVPVRSEHLTILITAPPAS